MSSNYHNLLLLSRSALGRIAQSAKGGLLIPDVRCQPFVRQNWGGVLDVMAKFSSPRIGFGLKI
jgi:hypothetical protein